MRIYWSHFVNLHSKMSEAESQIKAFYDWRKVEDEFLMLYRAVGTAVREEGGEADKDDGDYFGPKAVDAFQELQEFLVHHGVLSPQDVR